MYTKEEARLLLEAKGMAFCDIHLDTYVKNDGCMGCIINAIMDENGIERRPDYAQEYDAIQRIKEKGR